MSLLSRLSLLYTLLGATAASTSHLPLVLNTWSGSFAHATDSAFTTLLEAHSSPIDAVVAGCRTCQDLQCDRTVGYGGSPDESCETSLDALLIDGDTLAMGAVANLRRVRDAVGVARAVMLRTHHTMLAGEQATQFAAQMGFREEDTLATAESRAVCDEWKKAACQPNYWRAGAVTPDPQEGCGPYEEASGAAAAGSKTRGQASHDTISMIAIGKNGSMAAATSTNGARHKIPGRVGDGPIPGSGSYVDSKVGGCGATGDGDIMMRFLPCYQAVESMRRGRSAQEAADDAVKRMVERFPAVQSGIVVVDSKGEIGASASGWEFSYSYRRGDMKETKVVPVHPLSDASVGDEL